MAIQPARTIVLDGQAGRAGGDFRHERAQGARLVALGLAMLRSLVAASLSWRLPVLALALAVAGHDA